MVREANLTFASGMNRVQVPREFPDILKQFTKAAIKTHPADLLVWASSYFEALADGERPLVKERLELTDNVCVKWISLGTLRLIHRQIHGPEISLVELWTLWRALALDQAKLGKCLEKGQFENPIIWSRLLAIICRDVTTNLVNALRLFCEVVTSEPEGCPANVPLDSLLNAYEFLLEMDRNENNLFPKDIVIEHLKDCADSQNGLVHPGNIWSIGSHLN